jgi:phosphatidate cytidylyltransferase
MSNTIVRFLVGITGIPIIIYLVVIGNVVFLTFCVIASLFCMNEFYNLFEKPKSPPPATTRWLGGFSFEKFIFLLVSSFIVVCFYYEKFNYVLILYFIMFIFLILSELFKKVKHFEAIGTWLLSMVYISSPFGLLALMASDKFIKLFGENFALVCLALIWISDTFAFWGGKTFGTHKLAEKISPKKTWEGSAFGFLATVAGSLALKFFLYPQLQVSDVLIIAVVVGLTAQLGDLFESHLKRTANVKDSSQLIPGHGGVLDRFDSLLFAAPALYIFLYIRSVVL